MSNELVSDRAMVMTLVLESFGVTVDDVQVGYDETETETEPPSSTNLKLNPQ